MINQTRLTIFRNRSNSSYNIREITDQTRNILNCKNTVKMIPGRITGNKIRVKARRTIKDPSGMPIIKCSPQRSTDHVLIHPHIIIRSLITENSIITNAINFRIIRKSINLFLINRLLRQMGKHRKEKSVLDLRSHFLGTPC